jgi:DNA-binding SARP family transcriptional activator
VSARRQAQCRALVLPDAQSPFAYLLGSRRDAAPPTARIHRLAPARVVPEVPAADAAAGGAPAIPTVAARLLGPFRAQVNGHALEDLPHRKAKALFKYLLLHRAKPVARELLMETFWPAAGAEAARNSLNVAIHRLRRALGRGAPGCRFVAFADEHYALDPGLEVWTDADAFLAHVQRAAERDRAGELDGALREYAAGTALYRGELLADDRYAEWVLPLRQQFRERHLQALDRMSRIQFDRQDDRACIASCTAILAVDACDEAAHRLLMRCYARSGRLQVAHRQYQACVQALRRVLDVAPSAETTALYFELVPR